MLVLKRTKGKKITLFKDGVKLCEIAVLDVESGTESGKRENHWVKLGFDAPEEVKILRNELLDNKAKPNAVTTAGTTSGEQSGRAVANNATES